MRRVRILLWAAGLVGTAAGLAFNHAAENGRPIAARAGDAPRAALPLTQVVLFNSGVGYFQREGPVEGDARIDLAFPADDVNDLLKSLILKDADGHGVQVSYDGPEPIERTLGAFAVDLTGNPTFGQILNQARGEPVEVTLSDGGVASTLTGRVVGMESQTDAAGKETHSLNLRCDDGLRSVALARVQRVRFLNPAIDAELQAALRTLAAGHDTKKKQVHFDFRGAGRRKVGVGFVVESPIWKTTYRLSFDGDGKPRLESWAVVENSTDEDWNNVRLTLVSGRPLSFTIDLYQPLFVPRPKVEPEQFASLRPPAYNGAIVTGNQTGANLGGVGGIGGLGGVGIGGLGVAGLPTGGFQGAANLGGALGQVGGQFGQNGTSALYNRYQPGFLANTRNLTEDGDPAIQPAKRLNYQEFLQRREEQAKARQDARQLGNALTAVDPKEAANDESEAAAGKPFQHTFVQDVSLARQKSALVRILDAAVEGQRVSVFNEEVDARAPLSGLKFKNTTGKPLMQGPLTVYEAGRYAGDARILDLQPGEERLLAFAVDQGVEAKTTNHQSTGPRLTIRTLGDAVRVQYTVRRTRTYLFRNRSEADRRMVIEHPIETDWVLAGDNKASERTRDHYRFETDIPAGKATRYDVAVERPHNDPFSAPSMTFKEGDWFVRHYATGNAGVEFDTLSRPDSTELTGLKVTKGQVTGRYRRLETVTYRVRNNSGEAREVTLEHQTLPGHTLMAALQPIAGSTDRYLFRLKIDPGKVSEETLRELSESAGTTKLSELDEEHARPLLASAAVSEPVKALLREALKRRREAEERRTAAEEAKVALKTIVDEQGLLRANLERLPAASAAYKRYLEKFDTQETEIEKLHARIDSVEKALKARQQDDSEFLANATAE